MSFHSMASNKHGQSDKSIEEKIIIFIVVLFEDIFFYLYVIYSCEMQKKNKSLSFRAIFIRAIRMQYFATLKLLLKSVSPEWNSFFLSRVCIIIYYTDNVMWFFIFWFVCMCRSKEKWFVTGPRLLNAQTTLFLSSLICLSPSTVIKRVLRFGALTLSTRQIDTDRTHSSVCFRYERLCFSRIRWWKTHQANYSIHLNIEVASIFFI